MMLVHAAGPSYHPAQSLEQRHTAAATMTPNNGKANTHACLGLTPGEPQMPTSRQKLAVTNAKLARVNSHGEGLARKVAQALLCDGLEVGRLIVLWGVLVVSQLHEEVPLWHQQQ